MASASDHESLLRLLLSGAGTGTLRRLLETYADPAVAVASGSAGWRAHGMDDSARAAMHRPDREALARSLRWLNGDAHRLIGWGDPDYPPLLRETPSPPVALFVAGDPALLWRPSVAVVGSRAATAGGRGHAAAFATTLANAGLCVVSGLAAGIDASAHAATLACGGATVAVLGTGPDIVYPRRNLQLMVDIAGVGAVVSEHLPGTPALPSHFPGRNRIVAGLGLATLVVEAAHRSGALITARLAAEFGREVFAIPGSILNPMARGCHRLIRDGATLVESPEEILAALAPQVATLAGNLRGALQPEGTDAAVCDVLIEDPDYKILWEAIGHDPICMDELVVRTGLTAARASSMLLALELDRRVVAEHGRYSRVVDLW